MQHYPNQKIFIMSKGIMHGGFVFVSSLNAVLRTPSKMFTHHYVCVDALPGDSFE
jgi:hypothetical protein